MDGSANVSGDNVVAEAIGRVEGKLDGFDNRLRTLEIASATTTATLAANINRPAPVWPAIVSAVVPNLISATTLIYVLVRTGQ